MPTFQTNIPFSYHGYKANGVIEEKPEMKPVRLLLPVFILASGCFASHAAFAATPVKSVLPADSSSEAKAANTEADRLLRHGRNFEVAVEEARKAVQFGPKDSRYRITLACTLASRAASIAFAASNIDRFHKDQEQFVLDTKVWLDAQQVAPHAQGGGATTSAESLVREVQAFAEESKDPAINSLSSARQRSIAEQVAAQVGIYEKSHYDNFGVGSARPQPPRLRTRDDSKAFVLGLDKAIAEFDRLGKEALAQSQIALDESGDSKDRAQTLMVQSWVALLLYRYAALLKVDAPVKPNTILAGFKSAASLEPAEETCWQSLGDACAVLNGDGASGPCEEAISAYSRALSCNKWKHRDINYRIFFLSQVPGESQNSASDAQAAQALHNALRFDESNALPSYLLAYLTLEKADCSLSEYEHGVDLVEAGNALSLQLDSYQECVPPCLSAAWAYSGYEALDAEHTIKTFTKLGKFLASRFSHSGIDTNENEMAVRAFRAEIGIGVNVDSIIDKDPSAQTFTQKRMGNCAISVQLEGYRHLISWYNSIPDNRNATIAMSDLSSAMQNYRKEATVLLSNSLYGYGNY